MAVNEYYTEPQLPVIQCTQPTLTDTSSHCCIGVTVKWGSPSHAIMQSDTHPHKCTCVTSYVVHSIDLNVHTYPSALSQSLGFSADDQLSIQKLLGAILHLGNIKLVDAGDGESSRVSSMIVADRAAALLGTTKTALAKALTIRLVAAKGEVIEAQQTPARATYARDALAKVT